MTRAANDLHIINSVHTVKGSLCLKYKGAKLWNDLPLILKQTNSFSKFKFMLWNYLMNGCD